MAKAVQKRTIQPRRRRATPMPDSADPIDIAMGVEKADPADSAARQVLLGQAKLQKAQLFSERLSITLKLLTGLAGLALALAFGVMVAAAARADGLVIHAFSVPPDLEERGLTGEVVAARVLDRLTRMTQEANLAEPPNRYASDWANSISIEIPQTGVSVAELNRLLRQWLGREQHLYGELVRTSDGLSLQARTGGDATLERSGADPDLDLMLDGVAEEIFAKAQPRRFGQWLIGRNRREEAIAHLDAMIATSSEEELAWAYALKGSAAVTLSSAAAREALLRAIELDPDNGIALTNLATIENWLGHWESALRQTRRFAEVNRRNRDLLPEYRRQRSIHDPANAADLIGDYTTARDGYAALMQRDLLGFATAYRPTRSQYIQMLAKLHEASAAEAAANAYLAERANPSPREMGLLTEARMTIAAERGDWASVVSIFGSRPGASRTDQPAVRMRIIPALLALGRIDEARALVDDTGLDCQPCVVARGQIAAAQGDHRRADHWFAQAVRMAPSFPFANRAWGEALLQRGDVDTAIAKFQAAYRQSPRHPDNLHLWGEALFRKGDFVAAAARFEEVDRYAPRWGRNHVLWGETLWALGRKDEAVEHWKKALTLDLSQLDQERAQSNLLAR